MNELTEKKFPYLANFIKTAVERDRLFHSIIFYGGNVYMQYLLALEIARLLNCLGDGEADCQCQNCRWIRENRHPEITTISKIDNKTDSSKTVISKEQVDAVLDKLINASDYKRVFIFCDAEIKKPSEEEKRECEEFLSAGFKLPQEDADEKIWYPSGITTQCFSSVVANAMLKSIEEPPSGVTFIFLTNNKDDLIPTIVSRSQAFYVGDTKFIKYDTSFLDRYFSKYPEFDKNLVLDFSQCLYDYQTQNDYSPDYVLTSVQYYLTELLKSNVNNDVLRNKIYKDIKQTEKSKEMLKAHIKEQTVYEDLVFYFAGITE